MLVVNQSGLAPVPPRPHPRLVGTRPGMMSTEELQELLDQGEILEQQQDETGRTIVSVSNGRRTVSAIHEKRTARGFYPRVAAYRLDRLLELDMVPVTVVREVRGAHGSLQFLADKRSDEKKRSASGRGVGASCSLPDQWSAMYVFDVLIYNEGRTMQRMLYDPASWRLMLSEHGRAFARKKGRPKHLNTLSLEITDGWIRALGGLTDDLLAEKLGDVLDSRRLRALQTRRDELLASAPQTASR